MNINLPMAKGIVDEAFLEKNRVVAKRKNVNPLGNFWQQNLNHIFKDFWAILWHTGKHKKNPINFQF